MDYRKVNVKLWILVIITFAVISAGTPYYKSASGLKVKSRTVFITETSKGNNINYKDEFFIFDRKGNELIYTNFKRDGSVREKVEQRYDKFGNLIEKKVFKIVKDREAETIKEHMTFKYNSIGKKIEEAELQDDGKVKNRTAISYNNEGKKSRETVYGSRGDIKKQFIYTYNRNRLQESRITLDGSGDTLEIKKNVYVYY